MPGERAEFLAYWSDLLRSGAPALAKAGKVPPAVVRGMQAELQRVAHDPDAVFWYSFVQARARACRERPRSSSSGRAAPARGATARR